MTALLIAAAIALHPPVLATEGAAHARALPLRPSDVRLAATVYGLRDLRTRWALSFSLRACHATARRGACVIHEDGVDMGYGNDPAWGTEYRLVVTGDGRKFVKVKSVLFDGNKPLRVRRVPAGRNR